jgi:hypothetical protein
MKLVLLLLLPLCKMCHCLGPLSLFGSKYLFRQLHFPSSHEAGRINRGEYARQFGRWGDHLIQQLGRGHRVRKKVDLQLFGKKGRYKLDSLKLANSDPQSKSKTEYRRARKYDNVKGKHNPLSDSYRLLVQRIFNIFSIFGDT